MIESELDPRVLAVDVAGTGARVLAGFNVCLLAYGQVGATGFTIHLVCDHNLTLSSILTLTLPLADGLGQNLHHVWPGRGAV